MNNNLNYQVIELIINGYPALQTIGLYHLIGIEFSIQLVIDKPLARGLITQISKHYLTLIDQPSLLNDPWITYVFQENNTLSLLPFVLLKEDEICYIIVPDLDGLYPWEMDCKAPFNHQVNESLMIGNLLATIKAYYLSHLIRDVAPKVYEQIGLNITLEPDMPIEDIPDFLAEYNLDMYIVLMLCFNETIPQINELILSSCQSISLDLMDLSNPLTKAFDIASEIYDPIGADKYITIIMRTFHRLTEG